MSFVTSIYSALGLGLVSFRFNDTNSFSKLKKKKNSDFSRVRTGVCAYMDPSLLVTTLKIIVVIIIIIIIIIITIIIIIIIIIIIYCSVSNKVRLFIYNIYIINLL